MSLYFQVKVNRQILNLEYPLEDGDITSACLVIIKQWPHVFFQTPLLSQLPDEFQYAGHREYIQVLFLPGKSAQLGHWVSFTNIGGQGRIRCFDSIKQPLQDHVIRVISGIANYLIIVFSFIMNRVDYDFNE